MNRISLLLKDLKQKRKVRWAMAFCLFPFAYIMSFVHPYYGCNLLLKIFLTELSIFDRIVAARVNKILPLALSHFNSKKPEFEKTAKTFEKPKAEYIVIKPYVSREEKGVISIHWRWQIDIFYRNYDVNEILKRYILILGVDCYGSEWTYPFLGVMYKGKEMKCLVFTSVKDELTSKRLSLMGFVTIPYGLSCDFINSDKFKSLETKNKAIDAIMIANWHITIKRHHVFFKALEKINKPLYVVLVGSPCGEYTHRNIKEMESRYSLNNHSINYFEDISQSSLNSLLNMSKVSIVTSLMEGGNRACFESFFANTPAIILKDSLGVPKDYFNNKTGILCEERRLHVGIEYMLNHYRDFSPRVWALTNISPQVTRDRINAYLKDFSGNHGMSWTVDCVGKQWRGQSFEYLDESIELVFQNDNVYIESFFKYKE